MSLWDDENPKGKRKQPKKEFKKAMITAVWRYSDYEDKQSEAQCHEEKLCLDDNS